ncbi:related to Protein FAF1 [Saccharomycodes ludwigii]|uniref:Related to Protein FAF1 n=1 Tax=Saccharomycodes ludwigii TaxID=36035 RepID=A0A376B931_9ASCO|nr:related to Protein FAF1 [Saccharomycodes ludwigii]
MTINKDNDVEYLKQLEAQRLAFETQFGTLESMGFKDKTKVSGTADTENNDDNSDTCNVSASDSEDNSDDNKSDEKIHPHNTKSVHNPKIIKFDQLMMDDSLNKPTKISKADLKLLKSGKSTIDRGTIKKGFSKKNHRDNESRSDDENENEMENLRNDIELQNFIKESHLLSAFSNRGGNGANSFRDDEITGKVRMKTLEQRLKTIQDNNHNVSNRYKSKSNTLESMPMNVRKGMVKKHLDRIDKYEKFAKENGIVLSKNGKKDGFRKIDTTYKKDIQKRIGSGSNRNIGGSNRRTSLKINSVGKSTRNGLILSKAEIRKINGGDKFSNGGSVKRSNRKR